MSDPYKVLGVSAHESDEEIKLKYRELVKKYHPDNYAGSPLADLAGEKMAEINAAYDEVTQQRKNPVNNQRYGGQQGYGQGYGQSYNQGYGQNYGYEPSGEFADIRQMIARGRVLEAEEVLNGVAQSKRSAEWNFLKGNCLYNRGLLEDALGYFNTAANMEPQNPEYRGTLEMLMRQRQYGQGRTATYSGCSPCGLCTTMLCANCTCNMCRCCI